MRRPAAAAVLGAAGVALTTVSAVIEFADAEPRAELWVGAAAGVAFLLAVPLVGGGETQALTTRARLLAGAGAAAVLAVIGLWQATARDEARVLLLLVPALLLFVTAFISVREAARSDEALRTARIRSRLDGQEAERLRWAQELHDQTLQDLAAIEVRLGRVAAEIGPAGDPEATANGVQEARGMVRDQIRGLRHLITQMRPLALDTLGLAAALQDLAERAEDAAGIPVVCDVAGLPAGVAGPGQVSIYRIVQEAVTNALRHAACHRITIVVDVHDGVLDVVVSDDGIGLETPSRHPARPSRSGGFGRLGMTERAQVIGGSVTWICPAAGGTKVILSVPVAAITQA